MTTRLFLAIPIPDEIKKSLSLYTSVFTSDSIRPVKSENYHITVSFFGEQNTNRVAEIAESISSVAAEVSSFQLQFDDISFAPPKRPPSMIWAQYLSSDAFTQLVRKIEERLQNVINFKDQRNGHVPIPHITLARFRNTRTANLPQVLLDPIPVTALSLFESKRTESGPIYTELETFPLQ
jgi:RNA 2',3'-cyclic 3'-phosphodiesterase